MIGREQMAAVLQKAAQDRKNAQASYRQAIALAKQNGWTNTDIGRAVGVSEAAIRRYWNTLQGKKRD